MTELELTLMRAIEQALSKMGRRHRAHPVLEAALASAQEAGSDPNRMAFELQLPDTQETAILP